MGAVAVDIYKNDYPWHNVNLSSVDSIKALIKYRSQFDLLHNREINQGSMESHCDLSGYSEEIMCLYIWLDDVISKCVFNQKQYEILKLHMKGYYEEDIAQHLNIAQQSVNGIVNSIAKKIKKKVDDIYKYDYVYLNKKKVEWDYKQCSKCKEYLPAIDEFFGKRNTGDFYNYCKECDSLRKKTC